MGSISIEAVLALSGVAVFLGVKSGAEQVRTCDLKSWDTNSSTSETVPHSRNFCTVNPTVEQLREVNPVVHECTSTVIESARMIQIRHYKTTPEVIGEEIGYHAALSRSNNELKRVDRCVVYDLSIGRFEAENPRTS